jgi:hypothetical protein
LLVLKKVWFATRINHRFLANGDKVDNIPGGARCYEKTALALLQNTGGIDIYENLEAQNARV